CNKTSANSFYKQIEDIRNSLPMKYFTREEITPSEKTLKFIRQFAYTYRAIKLSGKTEIYCLN
ncbi:hypothetical protein, partial [Hoylesella oralis]